MTGIMRKKTEVEICIRTWSVIKILTLTHTQNTSLIERMSSKATAVGLVALYWCLVLQAGIWLRTECL
jgi:hypothetical protein